MIAARLVWLRNHTIDRGGSYFESAAAKTPGPAGMLITLLKGCIQGKGRLQQRFR